MQYKFIDQKVVSDQDGFLTDYSWYKQSDGKNIFIFGDSDLYTPEDTTPDYETFDDNEAREHFYTYEGFEDDEDEEEYIDNLYHDASEDELRKMGAFDNLNEKLLKEENSNELSPTIVDLIANMKKSSTPLETAFDIIVPSSGKAETVAGEIVRATMRILYRWNNDGDKFFESYGLEVCASSAEYLMNKVGKPIHNLVDKLIDEAPANIDNNNYYDKGMDELNNIITEWLYQNPQMFIQQNTIDSRFYPHDYITAHQPKYSYTIQVDDNVEDLLKYNVITTNELYDYVQDLCREEFVLRSAEVEKPWSTSNEITVNNLTKDGLNYLVDATKYLEDFWSIFVQDYENELESIHNGEYDI